MVKLRSSSKAIQGSQAPGPVAGSRKRKNGRRGGRASRHFETYHIPRDKYLQTFLQLIVPLCRPRQANDSGSC